MTYVGKKVKDARKRAGLTQLELATHSGVSVSTIRKLEQGERAHARMETLHALAQTLRVPTMALVEQPEGEGAPVGARELWAPVHAVVTQPPRQAGADEATPGGVRRVLANTWHLYKGHRFAQLAAVLPALLNDVETLDQGGRGVRAGALGLAAGVLVHTRQFDTAEVVVHRAIAEAQDRLEASVVVNTLAWLLMRQGRLDEALALATQWADDLEPRITRATAGELSAWGLMLLRASGAAVRNNQPEVAADMLRWARSAAAAIGREVRPPQEQMRTFGPTSVRLHTVEDALMRDAPDRALALADNVPLYAVRPSISVRNRHRLDVARAHARLGQYTEAFEKLSEAQRRSPEWFPNQTPARDTLEAIVAGRRTLTPEMRRMADTLRLGL